MIGAWRKYRFSFYAGLLCAWLYGSAPAFAEDASIEWPASGTLSLSDGDTLEFTLKLPASIIENAPEDAMPAVSVWLDNAGSKDANGPPAGRVLAVRSSRPGEWLVQVRGIKPSTNAAALELRTQWRFTKAGGTTVSGELRFPGQVSFGTKAIDVVLLMDGSWSMNESDPKRQRVNAVRDFIATARQSSVIGRIGIVQFDSKSTTLIPLTPLSGNFESAINAISAVGLTDIEGGIRHALNSIEPARRNGAAIVLFTDGNQEPGEYLNAHLEARKAGVNIHTMTLGRDADRKLLRRIAEETGGSYADAEKDNDISAAYAAIMSRIVRLRSITSGELTGGNIVRVPVDPASSAVQIATVSEKPGKLKLQLPGGQAWTSGEASNPQYFSEKPAHGTWSAQWEQAGGTPAPRGGAAATLSASARTALYPLFFRASPLPAAPVELDANDPRLSLSLFYGDEPVRGARAEARFDYVVRVQDEKKTEHARVSLFDDGAHGDGAAGDGIYAADIESLEFLARNQEFIKGTLSVVVTGDTPGVPATRGIAFQRELQTPFIVQRYAPPALVVTGALDLGAKYPGETTTGQIHLRVRGAGGALTTALENTPPALAGKVRLVDPPALLKPKEKRTQALEITLPDALSPGEYSGLVRLDMAGVEGVKIPWRVSVLPVAFKAEPARLDLGAAFPGSTLKARLKIATNGGTFNLQVVSAPLLKNMPFTPFTLDKAGREIELEFAIPENSPPVEIAHELVFTDVSNHERARVPVVLNVLPVKLLVDANLDFGTVEAGDELKRDITLKWEGGAKVPLTPRIVAEPGGLATVITKPVADRNSIVWRSQFSLAVPRDAGRSIRGVLKVEAGPFTQMLNWTATVVQPGVVHSGNVDFGRGYPGKKIERRFKIDFTSARPIVAEFSTSPFNKPRVAGVTLPESALAFETHTAQKPNGRSYELTFALTIPDNAQDGIYESALLIKSRVGNIEVPLSVKVVDVVDAAAFHVTPPRVTFRVTEGLSLPTETLTIVSHDDEPLTVALKIPALAPPPALAEGQTADEPQQKKTDASGDSSTPLPLGVLLTDMIQQEGVTATKVTLPPRGSVSVLVRPRSDVREGEFGVVQLDGANEHQEVELRVQRFAAGVGLPPVKAEAPKLLNWIISFFVLLLILAALLVRFFVKKAGVRYVCYAVIVHLTVFSLAMPQEALMSALPESIEVTLLDAQESLGISLSDQQARRLDALHSGGAPDDKHAPVLAQAPLPGKEGPVELPAPGAGQASLKPGPVNLDAARGVENPVRTAEVPEPARGALNAPIVNDAPLALDVDKNAPVMKEKPAPAPKVSADIARAVEASAIQTAVPPTTPSSTFTVPDAATDRPLTVQPSAKKVLPHSTAPIDTERPLEAPRKVETEDIARRISPSKADAPLNIGNDAPLSFDEQPVAAPQVRPNPKAPPPDPTRNIPVSARESDLGSPGLGNLNAPLTPLVLSAPGNPGSKGDGSGATYVAMTRSSPLPAADAFAGIGAGLDRVMAT